MGRRLTHLEPFTSTDAVHLYSTRTWSREKFVPSYSLDALDVRTLLDNLYSEVEAIEERTGGHEILFVHIDPKYNSIAVIVTSIIFYNMKFYPIQCIDMH